VIALNECEARRRHGDERATEGQKEREKEEEVSLPKIRWWLKNGLKDVVAQFKSSAAVADAAVGCLHCVGSGAETKSRG
jgi:hypothetical protein